MADELKWTWIVSTVTTGLRWLTVICFGDQIFGIYSTTEGNLLYTNWVGLSSHQNIKILIQNLIVDNKLRKYKKSFLFQKYLSKNFDEKVCRQINNLYSITLVEKKEAVNE